MDINTVEKKIDELTEFYQSYDDDNNFRVDFLYAKNNIYNWNELEIAEIEKSLFNDKIFSKATKIFDLWEKKFQLKNVHMNDNFQFHYLDVEQKDCIPFVIHIENIPATVVRGHHLKRQIYLEPFAIGQASSLYNIHSYLMQTAVDKIEEMEDEKINNFLDFSLLRLNAGRLPINKITYFRKLAVYYEGVEKVLYRGKEKYCLVARVISGEILLPKKNQCYNCHEIVECNKDCFG